MFETLKELEPEPQEEKPTNYAGLWILLATPWRLVEAFVS